MAITESVNHNEQQPTVSGSDQIQVGKISGSKAIAIGRGATAVYQGLTVEEVAVLVAELKRVDQPTVWDGRIPYLGLTAFRESDAQLFFGRESLVDDLLERVQQANFITIAGPSGSGKSSVARAGLFHALRSGRLPKSDRWCLATMQPRGEPLPQLAAAIERLTHTPGSGNHIRQRGLTSPLALHEQIQTLLSDESDDRFVLLVDQFEETFTQTKDEAVREAFIKLLTAAAQAEEGRGIIVISLRSDFISHCARYPDLRALMSRQFQLVGAMAAQDLAKAITLPALEVGAEIDPALVSRIMADMKGEPGALPLMSFALRDLFEAEKTQKGEPMDMTLPEYIQRGGIESALERHANKVFRAFTDEQKRLAQNIFSKLIEVGQGRVDTRRTATFAELVPKGVSDESIAEIVNSLAEEGVRLITTNRASSDEEVIEESNTPTTVTIAHEKLIDAWPWLRQLVDENRDAIRIQNEIVEAAQEWEALNRDFGVLYRGAKLQQAIEWCEKNEIHITGLSARFLEASRLEVERAAREREAQRQRELAQQRALAEEQQKRAQEAEKAAIGMRRRRNVAFGLAAGAFVLAIVAFIFYRQAQTERTLAEARFLVAQGQTIFEENPLLSLALVLEGLTLVQNEEDELRHTVLGNSRDVVFKWGRLFTFGGDVEWVTPVSDNSIFVVDRVDSPGEIRLMDNIGSVIPLPGEITGVGVSWDKTVPAFAIDYLDTSAELRRTADGSLLTVLPGTVSQVHFGPDETGSVLVSYDDDVPDELRRTADGSLLTVLPGTVSQVHFSPGETGSVLISYNDDTPDELRRTADGSLLATLPMKIGQVQFSPNDATSVFVVSYSNALTELRRTTDGILLAKLDVGYINSIVFSPDEAASVFFVTYGNGTGELRRTVDGDLLAERSDGYIDSVEFSLDETAPILVVDYIDAPGELHRATDGSLLTELPEEVDQVHFIRGKAASLFVVDYVDTQGELRHTTNGSLLATLPGNVESVWFGPNDTASVFVVAYSDAVIEIRSTVDGSLLAELPGMIESLIFGRDKATSVFVVDYVYTSGELRDPTNGELLAELPGNVTTFGLDESSSVFILDYLDAPSELRRTTDGSLLAELETPGFTAFWSASNETIFLPNYDRHFHVLDASWLQAMNGQVGELSIDRLVELACLYPLRDGLPNEALLAEYFPDREPPLFRACAEYKNN